MAKLTEEQKQLVAQYGHMFHNTGGNDIVELMEREGVTYFANPVVAELQGSCWSQTQLLQRLRAQGLLTADVSHENYESRQSADIFGGSERDDSKAAC